MDLRDSRKTLYRTGIGELPIRVLRPAHILEKPKRRGDIRVTRRIMSRQTVMKAHGKWRLGHYQLANHDYYFIYVEGWRAVWQGTSRAYALRKWRQFSKSGFDYPRGLIGKA